MEEPRVKAAEAARGHHDLGTRNMCGVTGADPLLPRERQLPSGLHARRNATFGRIGGEDLVDQEGGFPVHERVEEAPE
jgi:hypothetical protein